eukprot:TRINITY_DN62612_c0_g1_i1.p1 TRINITY_DN62612_c0_g1~~TRINITY_DN62612_c0_g1_i1.p1  ORF type:complete len:393 (-),score=49.94 TRINITY_DN62612_c0_g1_i1:41-1219(-)
MEGCIEAAQVSLETRTVWLAFFGFGGANRSLAKLLLEKSATLASGASGRLHVRVVGIFTGRHGSVWVRPSDSLTVGNGISVESALALSTSDDMSALATDGIETHGGVIELGHALTIFRDLRERGLLDVISEAIPANYESGEPALSVIREALRLGVHVVSANKAPVALALDELEALSATEPACRFLFESACMDGVPLFNLAKRCLPAARVLGFEGILNSTTNVIISALEESPTMTFEESLARAQSVGITETDPSADIDGFDAAVKCVCLCRALLGARMSLAEVNPCEGIRGVSQKDVAEARNDGGKRLMLVCEGSIVSKGDGGPSGRGEQAVCSVRLRQVAPSSPMHSVRGASACITLRTDVLGPVTLFSTDPTLRDTGYGLLADLLEVANWR